MNPSIFLSALLLILLQTFACANVEQVCKRTFEPEHHDFCVQTLKVDPKSQSADKKGLAAIAAELTVKSFRNTKERIETLKKNKSALSKGQEGSLVICTDSYNIALAKLEQVNNAFQKGGFMAVTNHLTAALDKTTSCIDAFQKAGVDSLLVKENDEAMKLVHLTSGIMETA